MGKYLLRTYYRSCKVIDLKSLRFTISVPISFQTYAPTVGTVVTSLMFTKSIAARRSWLGGVGKRLFEIRPQSRSDL